ARRISERIDLARTTPRADLASSRYCLARDGLEYLLYLPSGGEVKVDLRKASGAMDLEWIDPASGESVEKGSAEGGAERMFRSPLENDALLWIRARARENSGKEKERS
ncbi:MAG: hypothetical protein JXA90_17180, partial [Planctomycetes bacterium]|nr:hypothetical protein [Planctomycetota bacterium]